MADLIERLTKLSRSLEQVSDRAVIEDTIRSLSKSEEARETAERERDEAQTELGLVIMACPSGRDMRVSPASEGVRLMRTALESAESSLSQALARIEELEKAAEELRAEVARLKTPDSYWDWNDPEHGYTDVSEALSDAPMGGVVRLMAGKNLDDVWATTRVLTVDDDGDWDDHEIACFDNPIDAEKCWSESLAAARASALSPDTQPEHGGAL